MQFALRFYALQCLIAHIPMSDALFFLFWKIQKMNQEAREFQAHLIIWLNYAWAAKP